VKDYYQLLQVQHDSSLEVITAAYRRLMRDAHPDHGGDVEHAKRLNLAYETLSDPQRRRSYDQRISVARRDTPQRSLIEELAFRLGVSLAPTVRQFRKSMK